MRNNLKEKIKKLNLILEVSKEINSTLNLSELLQIIMRLTKTQLSAEASSLMLLNEEENFLSFEVALGEKGDEVKRFTVRVGEGVAGEVASTGKPIIVNDVEKDPRFSPKLDSLTKFKTRSIICVPLKYKDKIIGVIEVINKINYQNFSKEDLEILQAIANQAAITIENARLYEELKKLLFSIVESLASAIDAKDPYTHGHSKRVASMSVLIAKELEFDEDRIEKIRLAGLLHDIGKIGIKDTILNKKERLSDEEYDEIKNHPEIGKKILEPIDLLSEVIEGIAEHHEHYDGSGYPHGLKGENISILARIISIADAFDAMTSERPYRGKMTIEKAIEEIEKNSGKQFDPLVVSALLSLYKKGKLLCFGS
ncbi:MAG TPA: HD domain-containing protein [Dictyoglomaceae bacterium]|nr:HD domain-containing protein [Dictyoglomaceae bacterium]HOL39815.1 HD domain-containing protein [Dictyoglomaceae bacterium]HOP95304.1 HD domain-containing protein [Dictyoglomaceae bacterium]HPP16230.1 HD domain-containing protein [Dictyoglomaceae bacterium]HPU42956.1 HD domain-containing protein [Dictyoglomaceae bacterium]